jgi:hypothetical protein
MESYKVDNSLRHVKLQVQAGVVGVAYTRVYLKETSAYKRIFDSEKGTNGNIPATKVGVNSTLDGDRLKVRTFIDFSNLTDEQREKAMQNMYLLYTVSGGPEGDTSYEHEDDEVDATNPNRVIVTKVVKFTV